MQQENKRILDQVTFFFSLLFHQIILDIHDSFKKWEVLIILALFHLSYYIDSLVLKHTAFRMIAEIFTKNEHFKVTMYGTSSVGLWPCIFEDNPHLKRIYRAYSTFILAIAACFTSCTLIKFFIVITDEVLFLNEAVESLCIASLLVMILIRSYKLRSKSVELIVRKILNIEEEVHESEDKAIIKIYNSYARQTMIFYIFHPLYLDDIVKYYPNKNLTVYDKPVPIKAWLPFQEQHYVLAYVLQVTCGSVVTCFVVSVDIFNFSLIIFPLGQIHILRYTLQNFDNYVLMLRSRNKCSRDNASFLTFRECILKHKDIISYVEELNDIMRNMMVSEFLQSSIQLAASMLQILMVEPNFQNMAKPVQFISSMLIRLMIYYWYANEITVQSSDIAISIYDNEWYNQPEETKKMMMIVMLRCEKKIGLEIGPFSLMSLQTLLGIIKGAYSYMTVVYK